MFDPFPSFIYSFLSCSRRWMGVCVPFFFFREGEVGEERLCV